MVVFHVVLFQFRDDISPQAVLNIQRDVLALKDRCLHPISNKPYMKTSIGGKDISVEGLQNGITHCFVMEFESEQDRTYYAKQDPVHIEFFKTVKESVSQAIVVDFIPGVFEA